jgi:hypothetical protein
MPYLQLHWLISCSCQIKHKEESYYHSVAVYIPGNTITYQNMHCCHTQFQDPTLGAGSVTPTSSALLLLLVV